ncbi:MAG: tRNA (cytidine(34)-2'-O)-methyltransferase [Leptospiraceae bacterium]|nr:tRNA (cytidine(34)-2'-O)-methyltransferase [Leptospiraceae bacterium]
MVIHIALFRPEIPQNTGNISRLCVGLGVPLHIIGTPSFDLSEKAVRRAGLDYWSHLQLHQHNDWESFEKFFPNQNRIFLVTKYGKTIYSKTNFQSGDCLVFGQETKGLPDEIKSRYQEDRKLFIPMKTEMRSINLSNSVAIVAYEATKQIENW